MSPKADIGIGFVVVLIVGVDVLLVEVIVSLCWNAPADGIRNHEQP